LRRTRKRRSSRHHEAYRVRIRLGFMPENKNLEILRESVEHQNSSEMRDRYLEPYSDDIVVHGASADGLDELRAFYEAVWDMIPDLEITIENAIADVNEVAVRYSWEGTHAETGEEISLESGLTWYRFKNGEIVERWVAEGTSEAVSRILGL